MSEVTMMWKLDPEVAAEHVFTSRKHEEAWLDAFTENLGRRRAREAFAHTLEVWNVSRTEAARFFGVSRQAVSKWLRQGVPLKRAGAISDLATATDLLVMHLKRDMIPVVVRRPIQTLGGITLMDLLAQGDTRTLLETCRDMFRFERAFTISK